MRHLFTIPALTALALASGGCATQAGAMHPTLETGGASVRALELPALAGPGQAREVRVLIDEAAVKLVTITLRQGTVLPEHQAAGPVTIQALQGAGTVTAGAERVRLDAAHAVFLAPDVAHSVEPDAGTDLVLLVYHLRGGGRAHR